MMSTITTPVAARRGADWLLESTEPQDVFTPERLSDEHRLIARTATEFLEKEVLPAIGRLETKDWALARALVKRAGDLGLLGTDVPDEDVWAALRAAEARECLLERGGGCEARRLLRQRIEGGLRIPGPEKRPHPGNQLGCVNRFDQVILRSFFQAVDRRRKISETGKHDHVCGWKLLRNDPQSGDPVHSRHVDVEQHDIEGGPLQLLNCFFPVNSGIGFKAARGETCLDRQPQRIFIIDYQNFSDHE